MVDIKKIHHYALSVENMKATVDWYMQTFNFKIERQFGFPDLGIEIVHLISSNSVRLELLHSEKSQPNKDIGKDAFGAISNRGSKHIGLQVDNIYQIADILKARGVTVLHDVTRVEMAGVTNFWILDNEGNQIELTEPINQ